jgi:hypothetical protein
LILLLLGQLRTFTMIMDKSGTIVVRTHFIADLLMPIVVLEKTTTKVRTSV